MASRNPLLLPFCVFAAGIYLSRLAQFQFRETVAAGVVLLALALIAWLRGTPRSAFWAVLAAIAFGGILTDLLHHRDRSPYIDAAPGETLVFSGCVVEPSALSEGRERFLLELDRGARARVSLYLKPDQKAPALSYGQRVELEGRARSPHNFENPGAFDYASYLAQRDIYWNVSVSSGSAVRVLPGECGSRFRADLFRLREAGLNRLDALYSSNAYALGMTRALLLGDSSRLEKIWTDHYRRTGTYHALVISGLHLTTLATCFLFLLRLCVLGPGWSLLLTAAAGWIYALLSGGETPVTRAAAGLTLFLAARLLFRRPPLLNVLAAVGIVFLLADPNQLFDASFHLSFLSVAMIGAFAAPIMERISSPYAFGLRYLDDTRADPAKTAPVAAFRVEMRLLAETLHFATHLPQRVATAMVSGAGRVLLFAFELLLISATIQAGLSLPMIVYFHRVSISGLTANLLVVPLTNLAVPTGFLAILTGWRPFAIVTSMLLDWSRAVVDFHAAIEPAWRVPAPPIWLTWMFLGALAVTAVTLTAASRWVRVFARAGLATAMVLLLWHPFAPAVAERWLELTAMDVGQGDCLLVASPEGKLMVVDAGGFPLFGRRTKPSLDTGEDVVSPYLWSRSIRRLDVLVATHAHEDHIEGLHALIDNFHPAEMWTGAFPGDDPNWRALRDHALRAGVRIRERRAGEEFHWGGARVQVLSPSRDYEASAQARNNDSVVLRLSYGATSFLLTGDVERGEEERMVFDGRLERTDVLKVAHHGSRTSSTPGFLAAAHPTFAVISDGFENIYRFPHPDVLERLDAGRVSVFRTDFDGLVTIRSDGRRIRTESYRAAGLGAGPMPVSAVE